MKERVFLSNNQDGMIENYRMMHFLNVTDVLTNRVNCTGSTFNITLFWRVVRDLRALLWRTWMLLPNIRRQIADWLPSSFILCDCSMLYWIQTFLFRGFWINANLKDYPTYEGLNSPMASLEVYLITSKSSTVRTIALSYLWIDLDLTDLLFPPRLDLPRRWIRWHVRWLCC